jgi:hypothetical protein
MSRDPLLKFRVRCSENRDDYGDQDPLEYFKTLDEAKSWARKAVKAGRFKRAIVQDMGGGEGRWTVLDEFIAPKNSN